MNTHAVAINIEPLVKSGPLNDEAKDAPKTMKSLKVFGKFNHVCNDYQKTSCLLVFSKKCLRCLTFRGSKRTYPTTAPISDAPPQS